MNLDAGLLDGKGINQRSPAQTILAELVAGIAAIDPARALALYTQHRDSEVGKYLLSSLAPGIGAAVKKTGDRSHLRELLSFHEEGERPQILSQAIRRAVPQGDFDAGLAFAKEFLEDPAQLHEAVIAMLDDQRGTTVADRVDWLRKNTPPVSPAPSSFSPSTRAVVNCRSGRNYLVPKVR